MPTYYLDHEGGNDTNDGTTFANRWKTFASGATAARIAPGDTIRVMGSPAPTSLGINGTWTGDAYQSTYAIVSSTNATPIVVTLSDANWTAMAPAVGDTIYLTGHSTNTNANGAWLLSAVSDVSNTITLVNADGTNSVGNGVGGATGTVRKITNRVVKLASSINKAIACTGNRGTKTNWTASASVTCSVNTTDFKEGAESQSIDITAGFTTGLAAYWATGTLNLSTYQQVSFWIKQTAGTIGAAGACTISLCSDTAGATPVNTVNIPALGALNQWMPVVVDTAGALGASIQSVAFNVVTDNGAQTFLVDNIIACKASSSADSLNLTSLIGKNSAGETWYGIQSINDVRVTLDMHTNAVPSTANNSRGYIGTTETVTTYKRETIKTIAVATSTTAVHAVQDSGTRGSPITFSGGWNRTDMSTQTLETWFDGQSGLGIGYYLNATQYITCEKLNCVRYSTGLQISANSFVLTGDCHANSNTSGVIVNNPGVIFNGDIFVMNNANTAFDTTIADNLRVNGTIYAYSNCTAIGNVYGVRLSGYQPKVNAIVVKNTTGYGVNFNTSSFDAQVLSLTTAWNASGAVLATGSASGFSKNYVKNASIGDATFAGFASAVRESYGSLTSINHGGITGDNRIYYYGGTAQTETTVRHTASGSAWKLSVTSTDRDVNYPLTLPIAKVACAASALVTVKAWMRRSNTGLTMRLMCKGGQIGGVAADVSSSMTAAADTWEELTITFTPNEAGVVEITAEAYGGSTYSGYVDDMTISQA